MMLYVQIYISVFDTTLRAFLECDADWLRASTAALRVLARELTAACSCKVVTAIDGKCMQHVCTCVAE
jgi:hypothetical protein